MQSYDLTPNVINKPLTAIILGGGLAGTILAERLIASGKRVLLVDDRSKSQCSRVAAGLINPIGGKRLKLVWQADTFIPHANTYYRSLESEFGQIFFHARPLARVFANEEERQLWTTKRARNPLYESRVVPLPDSFVLPGTPSNDGFLISDAGYLDTNALLETLQAKLTSLDALLSSSFNYSEIQLQENGVSFRDYNAQYAIFAEGHLATGNPYFNFVPYKPAKGIIASLSLKEPLPFLTPESPILLKQKFLLPRHDGKVLVGATYNWDDPTDTPDDAGIQELEQFLDHELGSATWNFDQIRAGVRPATAGAYPVVGPHPDNPQIFSFNGFGSKGSLQIPYFADALAAFFSGKPSMLPPEALPSRFVKKPKPSPKRWLATEVAKQAVLELIRPGDVAIDATAGNGHDTQWLAEFVGEKGHVFAIDIQDSAVTATRNRLESLSLLNRTTLIQASHSDLKELIPHDFHSRIAAVVFNLGYLPGSDKSLITCTESTLPALQASLELLKPGGILSVVLYPAHPGGDTEASNVKEWAESLDSNQYDIRFIPHPNKNPSSPHPFIVQKADR